MITTHLVISSPAGQLGNRLIQFSNFIAFAKHNGFALFNPAFNEYSCYFDYWDQNILGAYPPELPTRQKPQKRWLRTVILSGTQFIVSHRLMKRYTYNNAQISERFGLLPSFLAVHLSLNLMDECDLENATHPLLQKMTGTKCAFFRGWRYRSRTHFDTYADEIKKLFTPKEYYLNHVESLVRRARQNIDLLIGIHIRHGDYKTHIDGRFFYSLEQYKQKMKEVKSLFPEKTIRFVVCTNGDFGEDDLRGFDVIFGNNEQLEDMYTFAYCDYIIGPPSTFTAWASFWGGAPVQHVYNPSQALSKTGFQVFDAQGFIELDQVFETAMNDLL